MWAPHHDLAACVSCGTASTPHKAHGLCRNCYVKAQGYQWQKEYQKRNRAERSAYAREWRAANPATVARSRRDWSSKNRDKRRGYLKTWRRKNKAPFCLICGEDRAVDWAHLLPHSEGAPTAPWNLIPLCPTHHRCFDAGKLHAYESEIIEPYLQKAREEHDKLK